LRSTTPARKLVPADVDAENGVVALEQPFGGEMGSPDQSGFVGIVADRNDVDGRSIGFENDEGRPIAISPTRLARKPRRSPAARYPSTPSV